MKALLVLARPDLYASAESVVLQLCERGHEVKVVYRAKSEADLENERVLDELFEPGSRFEGFAHDPKIHRRKDRWRDRIERVQDAVDRSFYLRRQYPRPELAARRQRKRPASALRRASARTLLSLGPVWRLARRLETLIPPDREIVRRLGWDGPDVVVTFPFLGGQDIEYARAARALGTPTVGLLDDWSDTTALGAIHLLPDLVLVWNEALAREARSVHSISRRRLVPTGATRLDGWLSLSASAEADAFCRRAGLDPALPFAVYFASAGKLSGETKMMDRAAAELGREVQLLVWPGTGRAGAWSGTRPENVTVWPERILLDTAAVRQARFDAISHASAVISAETPPLLEAAVLDKPCLAIADDRQSAVRERLAHLEQLADCDFVEIAADASAAARSIEGLIRGDDARWTVRRKLLEGFVRPGMGTEAGEIAAGEIERIAARRALGQRIRKRVSSARGRVQPLGPEEHRRDPVLIGANGGSGTRVFCRIASRGGIFMGAAVDAQEDSIALSRFYSRHAHPHLRAEEPSPGPSDGVEAGLHTAVRQHLAGVRDPDQRWGAKNPRSMLMLDLWHDRYPDLKFLHVVRSGLDMAYSVNHNQLKRYGPLVLSPAERALPELERAILFWERTNGRAADYGEERLGDRYLRVRLEDLCDDPATVIRLVFDFFEIDSAADVDEAAKLVQTPPTLGRWRRRPPDEVAEIAAAGAGGLRRFGYWQAYLDAAA